MIGVSVAPPGARFHGTLPKLGKPVHVAEYADTSKICTYKVNGDAAVGTEDGRRYLAWQWGADEQQYVQRALPDQIRPLYRPENLEAHPDWPVYVFEHEDSVDAFHDLSGDAPVIATTIPGGCSKFDMGDWDALYGRTVVLWPNNSRECVQAMHELGKRLHKAQSKVSLIEIPQDRPQGWSFLHICAAGWTWEQCEEFVRVNMRVVVENVAPIPIAPRLRVVSPPTIIEPTQKQVEQIEQDAESRRLWDFWSQLGPTLRRNKGKAPFSHLHNVLLALQHLKGAHADAWYDEFQARVMTDQNQCRPWSDVDTYELTAILQGQCGFAGARSAVVWEAVTTLAMRRKRHEVREWLDKLTWDGKPRLAVMLYDGWGAEKLPYTSAVGRCFLIGAVARIYRPGCQVDHVPVFEGPGGVGKTSSLRDLFGKWFDNPSAMFGDKDFLQNMRGKWCLELAEFANMRGRALEVVKAIITRTEDTYRSPYAREPATHPRQCVFAATMDQFRWNTDPAGGRRFWPFVCGEIDLDYIRDSREQLFAEAVERYKDGEPWHNVPLQEAKAHQACRRPADGWALRLERYLADVNEVPFDSICELLLGEKTKDWRLSDQIRARELLTQLGWIEGLRQTWRKG